MAVSNLDNTLEVAIFIAVVTIRRGNREEDSDGGSNGKPGVWGPPSIFTSPADDLASLGSGGGGLPQF